MNDWYESRGDNWSRFDTFQRFIIISRRRNNDIELFKSNAREIFAAIKRENFDGQVLN